MPPRAAAYRRADGLADVVAAEQELPLRNFCGIGPSGGRGDDLHGSERFADKVVQDALLLAAANKLAIRSLISFFGAGIAAREPFQGVRMFERGEPFGSHGVHDRFDGRLRCRPLWLWPCSLPIELCGYGAGRRDQTSGLCFTRAALCQLSY